MKKKILWMFLSFLLVAALVLASCAKEKVVVEEEEEEEEEEVVEEEEEEEVVAPPVGVPQRGGKLTYFYWGQEDPGIYDEHKGIWPTGVFTTPVLDYLIVGDVDKHGPGRGGSYEGAYPFPTWDDIPFKYSKGALAESWEVTPERIVFHIRPGVLWAAYGKEHVMEVREVTPEDIVWSLYHFIDEGAAEGPPGWLWTENGGFIDTIYAEGDMVIVETSRLDIRWKHWIAAGWGNAFYPPEALDPALDPADWMNLVGTGPFVVKEYVVGSYMSFERNPTYWDTTTIDGVEYELPFIDELIYPIIPDESSQVAALRTAAIDIHFELPSVYLETLAATTPELVCFPVITKPEAIVFNANSPILADYDVRRALVMAIDREAVTRVIFGPGGNHLNVSVTTLVPDAYTPFEELPLITQEFLTYDPVKAKGILADAGYPEGFTLKLLITEDRQERATMVMEYWKAIGVTSELKMVDGPTYTSLTSGFLPIEERLDYDVVFIESTIGDAPLHALDIYYKPGGMWNLSNQVDEYHTERLEYIKSIVDEAERFPPIKELAVYFVGQIWQPVFGTGSIVRYNWPWVKNYFGEQDVGCFYMGPLIARVWIDQDLKAEMGY